VADFSAAAIEVPADEELVLSNDGGKLAFTAVKRAKR